METKPYVKHNFFQERDDLKSICSKLWITKKAKMTVRAKAILEIVRIVQEEKRIIKKYNKNIKKSKNNE